jgi:formate/nitrite transporter FocA (FNT family)
MEVRDVTHTKHNSKLFLWALTSALAGFLFGFDTIVISGAEQKIQELWSLNSFMHGLAMSAALWGTVAGSLLGVGVATVASPLYISEISPADRRGPL